MLNQIRPAVVSLAALTLLLGLAYPLAVTGVAQVISPGPANGSLLTAGGRVVGSRLIGQTFTRDEYLHGRPSAAGDGYDPTQSGGSNLGPLDPKLADRIEKSAAALGGDRKAIPVDAVTTSASGLDPDISPAFAAMQAARIAAARHVRAEDVQDLIGRHTEGRFAGVIGEPRVNVLAVNVALDQRFGRVKPRS
jgi:K+-transporting ATPase ATPase C chain